MSDIEAIARLELLYLPSSIHRILSCASTVLPPREHIAKRLRALVERRGDLLPTWEAFRSGDLRERAQREFDEMVQRGIRLLHPGVGEWAPALDRLPDPPPCLFAWGQSLPDSQSPPGLVVVGTREPTGYGRECVARFIPPLAAAGVGIWSGMARGIDQEAHRAALASGGHTYAVLGSGLLRPYPSGREDLLERIRASGTILSEYPLHQRARRYHFPSRNRILAALGGDVLVVQAAARSGSLITAYLGVELGASVFVVPDRIDQAMARGCMQLLRDGAIPVTTAEELAADLGVEICSPGSEVARRDPLWDLLGDGSRSVDELVVESGIALGEVLSKITAWELEGSVSRGPSGRIQRAAPQLNRCRGKPPRSAP